MSPTPNPRSFAGTFGRVTAVQHGLYPPEPKSYYVQVLKLRGPLPEGRSSVVMLHCNESGSLVMYELGIELAEAMELHRTIKPLNDAGKARLIMETNPVAIHALDQQPPWFVQEVSTAVS